MRKYRVVIAKLSEPARRFESEVLASTSLEAMTILGDALDPDILSRDQIEHAEAHRVQEPA